MNGQSREIGKCIREDSHRERAQDVIMGYNIGEIIDADSQVGELIAHVEFSVYARGTSD